MIDLAGVRTEREKRLARRLLVEAIRVAPTDSKAAAILIRLDGDLHLLASPELEMGDLKLVAWALAKDAPGSERMATSIEWEFLRKARRILDDYERDGQRRTAAEFVDRVFLGLQAATAR